jgi:hypothetical protein
MRISKRILSVALGIVVALAMVINAPVIAEEQIEDVTIEEEINDEDSAAGEDNAADEQDNEIEDGTADEEDSTDEDNAEDEDGTADENDTVDEDDTTGGNDSTDEDNIEDEDGTTDDNDSTDEDDELDENDPIFSDMPDDWSAAALQHAVDNGLLQGYNGKIMPNNNLTRAEMATVIVRAFGAEVKGDLKDFTDIDFNEWYADDMARAYQMGVVKGTDNKMNPNNDITREEAFAIVARAFKLQPSDTINVEFSDVENITEWATGEVYALVNHGYIHGSNGELCPTEKITRAEFAQMLYNIVKQYVQTEDTITEAEEGNIVVNTANVTLKDITVNGDLVIGDGVGDGEVVMDNVQVTGRLVVRGGGTDSIIIKGNSDMPNVIVAKANGAVGVKVQDEANIGIIDIISENVKVEVSGKVANITIEAANAEITGSGQVNKVDVKAGGDNTRIVTPNTEITVGEDVTGVTGAGGEDIPAGTAVKNNEDGTGIIVPEPEEPGSGDDDEDNDDNDNDNDDDNDDDGNDNDNDDNDDGGNGEETEN